MTGMFRSGQHVEGTNDKTDSQGPPRFLRSKGMTYIDWKEDLELWVDTLGTNVERHRTKGAKIFFGLEENEKSIIRNRLNKEERRDYDKIMEILDKSIGKVEAVKTWQSYQDWKTIKFTDKRQPVEDFNETYAAVEKKMFTDVLRNTNGTSGDDLLGTTFRAFHYLDSLQLDQKEMKGMLLTCIAMTHGTDDEDVGITFEGAQKAAKTSMTREYFQKTKYRNIPGRVSRGTSGYDQGQRAYISEYTRGSESESESEEEDDDYESEEKEIIEWTSEDEEGETIFKRQIGEECYMARKRNSSKWKRFPTKGKGKGRPKGKGKGKGQGLRSRKPTGRQSVNLTNGKKMNPIDKKTGRPSKCHVDGCGSIYHWEDKCPLKTSSATGGDKKPFKKNARAFHAEEEEDEHSHAAEAQKVSEDSTSQGKKI